MPRLVVREMRIGFLPNPLNHPLTNHSVNRPWSCRSPPIGYKEEETYFLPGSAFTGKGVKDRIPEADCPWYRGPSLLEVLR